MPIRAKRRIRSTYETLRKPHLRRVLVRTPLARATLAAGAARVRRRRAEGLRVGVARLDDVRVINLEARAQRLAGFRAEMRRLQITGVDRFEAIVDSSGIRGCTLSHAAVMREMALRDQNCIMVCEDDARFALGRDQLDVLIDAFLDDEDAEVACLAYWHRTALPRNRLYMRTTRSFTTACYLVKSSIAADLEAAWEEGARELAAGGDREVYGLDHMWSRLQQTRVFLIPIVRAVRQAPGYSDIWEEYVDQRF